MRGVFVVVRVVVRFTVVRVELGRLYWWLRVGAVARSFLLCEPRWVCCALLLRSTA